MNLNLGLRPDCWLVYPLAWFGRCDAGLRRGIPPERLEAPGHCSDLRPFALEYTHLFGGHALPLLLNGFLLLQGIVVAASCAGFGGRAAAKEYGAG